MPAPRRRTPAPQAQTTRCRYSDGRQQCRRIATVGGGLCRQHALVLELDLEGPESDLIGTVDRMLARNGQPPIAELARGVLDGLLGRVFAGQQQAGRQHTPRMPPPQPPPRQRQGSATPGWDWVPPWARPGAPPPGSPPRSPPRSPAQPAPDPLLAARAIMGFEPTERLTVELVKKRKTALAQVFHPDRQGGSETQMKRVNAAADALLSSLVPAP